MNNYRDWHSLNVSWTRTKACFIFVELDFKQDMTIPMSFDRNVWSVTKMSFSKPRQKYFSTSRAPKNIPAYLVSPLNYNWMSNRRASLRSSGQLSQRWEPQFSTANNILIICEMKPLLRCRSKTTIGCRMRIAENNNKKANKTRLRFRIWFKKWRKQFVEMKPIVD